MRRRWLPAAAILLFSPCAARAQRAVLVRADNDAFNFWQAPWNRPDEEYTSGVRLELDFTGGLPWPGRRARAGAGAGPCDGERVPCVEHAYSFGQDIYTGSPQRGDTLPPAGARPDAGLLWFAASEHRVRAGRTTDLRFTVGTTGRPALGEPVQRFFHGIAPGWNRPIDWRRQLPAEPVFGVSVDERRPGTFGAAELAPHAGASLGTLLTEVRGGVSGSLRVLDGLHLVSDATLRAVARSEVLSGTYFRASERVPLRPLVTELQFGVRGSWRELSLAFIAHQTSAEYTGRTRSHAWSTLQAEWRR